LFALLLPASLAAQLPLTPPGSPTTIAAPEAVDILRARLLHQPLYLRSAAAGEHLSFTPDGSLTPAAPPTSFTLSGVQIDSVDRKRDRLVLKGKRVGLTFPDDHLKRNILKTPIVLDIAAPANGQYAPVLDRIFFTDLDDIIMGLPLYWRFFSQAYLSRVALPMPRLTHSCEDSTSPPRLIKQIEPTYTDAARRQRFQGQSLIHLTITPEGHLDDIFLVNAAGLGLDEEAVNAVRQYVFAPASRNGTPIACQINININFRIY